MTDERLTQEDFDLAREICTSQQTRALNLYRRGYGSRAIGVYMHVDRSTARQHVQAGLKRLNDWHRKRDLEKAA